MPKDPCHFLQYYSLSLVFDNWRGIAIPLKILQHMALEQLIYMERQAMQMCSGLGRQTWHGNPNYGNGPLIISEYLLCLKGQKSSMGWSKYIKGALAFFAWHGMAYLKRGKGYSIIILPLERFHPSGQTNYQAIKEPILKGTKESGTRLWLETVHPMVKGAENFICQI